VGTLDLGVAISQGMRLVGSGAVIRNNATRPLTNGGRTELRKTSIEALPSASLLYPSLRLRFANPLYRPSGGPSAPRRHPCDMYLGGVATGDKVPL
jgi:hypothetical protein